ncbi:hypothetical protein D3C79_791040 [compost metagenome]
MQTAVDVNGFAGNEARHLAGQEHHHRADIGLRLATTPQRAHGSRHFSEPRVLCRQLVEGGAHRGGRDSVGANVEAPPFGGRAAGQPHDGRLCCVVVAMQPGPDLDIDRVEVDDLAAPARLHVRERRLHRPPGCPHGRTQCLREHRIGLVFQQHVGRGRKRVVDQYVQATELVYGQLHSGFDIGLAADVRADEHRPGAKRLEIRYHRFPAGFIQFCDHHRSSLFGEVQRDASADSAPCAGNQRDLFVQQGHNRSFSCF